MASITGYPRSVDETRGQVYVQFCRLHAHTPSLKEQTPMPTENVDRRVNPTKTPLRVAAVFDVMTHRSHANIILENFLEPYYFDGTVVDPREDFQIVSLCADFPEGHEESDDPVRRKDMSKAVAREYGIPLYDTIAAAVCAGGEQLAVDAVLSIGEGGGGDKYGYTELGQPKYPRKSFFY